MEGTAVEVDKKQNSLDQFLKAQEVTLRIGHKDDDQPISPKTKWRDEEPRTGRLMLDDEQRLFFVDAETNKKTDLGPSSDFNDYLQKGNGANERTPTLYSQDNFYYRHLSLPKNQSNS